MVLDTKLDFNLHIKNVQNKVSKTIELLRKLQNILPRQSLITIYRSFIRPHLDYGDTICDRAYNSLVSSKYWISSIQCCASNYGCNKRNFKRKNLSRVRVWISTTKTLVQKILLLIWNYQKQVTKLSFPVSPFINF